MTRRESIWFISSAALDAGMRVPQPYQFLEGVLLMEPGTDAYGDAAPRLNELAISAEQAANIMPF